MYNAHAAQALPIAVLLSAATIPAFTQNARNSISFVIDSNREFVYLKFDHVGKGLRRREDEPEMRVWLRFVNNCNVPVELRSFGVPEGSLPGEAGIMDVVVEDPPRLMIDSEPPPPLSASVFPALESASQPSRSESAPKPDIQKQPEGPPAGYWFELGSLKIVRPGRELLFSIPVNQLGTKWHIQIPFEFEVPKGKVPRDPSVGGLPEMYLSYSLYDLPDEARAKIESQLSR